MKNLLTLNEPGITYFSKGQTITKEALEYLQSAELGSEGKAFNIKEYNEGRTETINFLKSSQPIAVITKEYNEVIDLEAVKKFLD